MNWDQARKLLRLARTRSESAEAAHGSVDRARHELYAAPRAHSLCIASGKGGTGKSVVSASLGTLLARTGRTLLVDADLGVGNAHILHDLCPPHSFVDVIEGRLSVRDIRVSARPQLDLLAGGSGVSRMAGLTAYELHLVAVGLESVEQEYQHVLVDSAAGISNQTIAFAAASDVVLVVTTPDVTALTDAYAFLKVLLQRRGDLVPLFVVNRATSEDEALHVADRLRNVSRKFLGREPRYLGYLPDDRHVVEAVNARRPAVLHSPAAPFAQALHELAVRLQHEFTRLPARGVGRTMLRSVGYTPDLG